MPCDQTSTVEVQVSQEGQTIWWNITGSFSKEEKAAEKITTSKYWHVQLIVKWVLSPELAVSVRKSS